MAGEDAPYSIMDVECRRGTQTCDTNDQCGWHSGVVVGIDEWQSAEKRGGVEDGREVTMIEHATPTRRTTTEPVLLTFKEAMGFLRVSRSTLYRLMWAGQLRGHKVGSTWRFYQQDLLDVVANPVPAAGLDLPTEHTARVIEG